MRTQTRWTGGKIFIPKKISVFKDTKKWDAYEIILNNTLNVWNKQAE
jgi:hypothetical protein